MSLFEKKNGEQVILKLKTKLTFRVVLCGIVCLKKIRSESWACTQNTSE